MNWQGYTLVAGLWLVVIFIVIASAAAVAVLDSADTEFRPSLFWDTVIRLLAYGAAGSAIIGAGYLTTVLVEVY